MILKEFPDLLWLKDKVNKNFHTREGWKGVKLKNKGWPNVILNAQSKKTYRDNIKGPFSIFLNISGKSILSVDNKSKIISEDTFIITNEGQNYTLEIDSNTKTETYNIHFGERFAQKAAFSLANSTSYQLDNGVQTTQSIEFLNNLNFKTKSFSNIIATIRHEFENGCVQPLREEELLFSLFTHIYFKNEENKKRFKNLPVIKTATRDEIKIRLLLSLDHIHAYYFNPLSLEVLSSIACLSKFHYLRLFKLVFNFSPYQYITRLRLQKGLENLQNSSKSIEEIASEIGYENGNSFSRLVYKKTGKSPSFYRK